MIAESDAILARLQSIQQANGGDIVRIGIGYMTSRKLLQSVVTVAWKTNPKLNYQLVPFEMRPELHQRTLARLGKDIDFFLVMYDPMRITNLNTLHLSHEPVCCAVSLQHPLARKERLSIQDLAGKTMLCFRQGFNSVIDAFRSDMERNHPEITLKDISYINEDTFNRCANSDDLLVAFPIWEDYHPGVKILTVDWSYTVPFGLRYALDLSPAALRFINSVKKGWSATD